MGRRKRTSLLDIIVAPILFLGKLDRASHGLKRFYTRPKHRGVMCSGPRRDKRGK